MQYRTVLSFFLISTGADAQSDIDGHITPVLSNFSKCFCSSPWKPRGVRLILALIGAASPVSISCTIPPLKQTYIKVIF